MILLCYKRLCNEEVEVIYFGIFKQISFKTKTFFSVSNIPINIVSPSKKLVKMIK